MDNREAHDKSLESVQRWVVSTLCIVLGGAPTTALAAYSQRLAGTDHSTAVGLCLMSGVIGLLTAAGVLVIHRRSLLSPPLALGLIPALIGAYYLF